MKARFALLALVVAAAPLAAQGGGGGGGGMRGGGGQRGGMNIDRMTTQYNLTADQKTKATALLDDYNKQAMPLGQYIRAQMTAGATAPDDSTKKQTQLRTDFNTKFRALLDGTQQKTFDSVQAAQPPRRGGGGGGK